MRVMWLLLLPIFLVPSVALADWTILDPRPGPDDTDIIMAVHPVTANMVFFGGMRLDMDNFDLGPVLYMTQDAGQRLTDIGTSLKAHCSMSPVVDVFFSDLKNGVVSCSNKIAYTNNSGMFWKSVEIGSIANKIHMFDALNGVAVGNDGKAWHTEDGGVSWEEHAVGNEQTHLTTMFVLDGQYVWSAGADVHEWEEEDFENNVIEHQEYLDVRVFFSNDRGHTWVQAWTTKSTDESVVTMTMSGKTLHMTINGMVPAQLEFLPGGQTGFLGLVEYIDQNQRTYAVHIMKTTDGGATFVDLDMPVVVGTSNTMISQPLVFDNLALMQWLDEDHGRFVGSAYVTEMSMGGSSPTKIYRQVMASTDDGGKTWKLPDFGEISIDMANSTNLVNEPRPMSGAAMDWYNAWVSCEKGVLIAWDNHCAKQSDCGEGYYCWPDVEGKWDGDNKCHPCDEGEPDPAWCPEPEFTDDTGGATGEGVDRDVLEVGPGPAMDVVLNDAAVLTDVVSAENDGDGCSTDLGAGRSMWPIIGLILLPFLTAIRSRRSPR